MATNCGTVTAKSPFSSNNVYVSGCDLQTTTVTAGESINISVPVNNDNPSRADVRVGLAVNGSPEAVDSRRISGNGSETFSFSFTPESAGDYDITTQVASATEV